MKAGPGNHRGRATTGAGQPQGPGNHRGLPLQVGYHTACVSGLPMPSFPRKRESRAVRASPVWIPGQARNDDWGTWDVLSPPPIPNPQSPIPNP